MFVLLDFLGHIDARCVTCLKCFPLWRGWRVIALPSGNDQSRSAGSYRVQPAGFSLRITEVLMNPAADTVIALFTMIL